MIKSFQDFSPRLCASALKNIFLRRLRVLRATQSVLIREIRVKTFVPWRLCV